MRAVIITGGSMADYAYIRRFIRPGDYIIAADRGYIHAQRLGVSPHVLLGDFDSLEVLPQGIEIHRFPVKKDATDTELAAEWAREQGASQILFLGAMGTRMDHSLSNILLLSRLLDQGIRGEMIDEHNHIWITEGVLEIEGNPGQFLSLVPLTACEGVTTENLEYPLFKASLQVGSSLGISNVISGNPAGLSLTKGRLLVMLCRD